MIILSGMRQLHIRIVVASYYQIYPTLLHARDNSNIHMSVSHRNQFYLGKQTTNKLRFDGRWSNALKKNRKYGKRIKIDED